jgi:uncharacterized ParB-like nuclease family protein
VEKIIKLCEIRLDGGTQPRTEIDQNLVDEYAENIDQLPPVTVFFDGVKYWLADGFHRYHAHNRANLSEINCIVINGTQRDAILHSVGVNADHGKRRTNEDKRKAVLTLLKDEEWSKWSNRQIAKACKVSPGFVDIIRKDLPTIGTSSQVRKYIDQKGRESVVDTSNIGKKTKSEQKLATKQECNVSDTLDTIAYEQVINILSDASQATLRAVLGWIEDML